MKSKQEDSPDSQRPKSAMAASSRAVSRQISGSNGAALDRNGTVGSKLDGGSVSMPPSDEKETKAVMARRSSIIRDPSERRNRIKKTVSFTSNPNSRKIITVADCIAYMIAGCRMVKVRSNSRQYWRTFTLDPDKSAVRWTPTSKKPDQAKVLISSMKEVLIGKKTDVFRGRDASECLEECCFSIVYGDQGETLDLMAKDADETNAWVTGLMSLMGAADLIETMFHGHPDERNGWLTSCFRRKIAMSTITKEHHLSDEQVVELISELCPTFSSQKIRHRLKESLWKSSGGESPRAITQVDEELFLELYKEVTTRPEIYHLLIRHSNKEYMTTEDLVSFLEVEQGMVDVSHKYAATVIEEFEPGEPARTNNHLHIEGLTRFLISDTCDIFDMEQRTVCQDMNQPLSHYFIASSHNTYLVEDQLKGPSSVEGYVQALANGARFVEIDLWDGDNNDPVVYHGHTLTSKLPFRRVMEAVKAYAFERSPYPLILSIEMHCSMQQQAVVVELLHECLGPFLWQAPSDGEPGQDLPSPETLRNKILILGRKLPPSKSRTVEDSGEITEEDESAESLKFRNHQRTGSIKKIRLSKGFSDLVSCQYYRFQSFQKSRSQGMWCLDYPLEQILLDTMHRSFVQ
ncbi:hypothetical protein RvY_09143-2 [Ramazzottius varieornatus]|uniref:Phosphoinositide phospholipase C n=1 Tax=Ramazzottius varieornatus TaxID=947166 RepID=A0A1D1VAT0_RAMVA|nr:hypothetical protein RvY_09143-2 [Ramazzottius varieornatus]